MPIFKPYPELGAWQGLYDHTISPYLVFFLCHNGLQWAYS
jgi:hypothetical protein